jgi:distribution and morphology protein 34
MKPQANPLNTYLCSKPDFTSPQPLAAASGLTIPLQITLSEIKLSAFIILVFSKQKGLTLVFRNDPLESLKVSSTFDSIQFVRDYLQRTIEGKLRDLMMDELPAIIHRLSLQLWCPDQLPKEEDLVKEDREPVVDPLASPPLDAVDAEGHLLDQSEIAALSLDGGPEVQSLFSQKNMLRLSTLTDSNRTLSLYTPSVKDVMFRAWAGVTDRLDTGHNSPSATPSLTRSHSFHGTATTYTFSDADSHEHGHLPARPSMVSLNSATTGLTLGSGRNSKGGRKKKNRVVNLRKKSATSGTMSETASEADDTSSDSASIQAPMSEPLMSTTIPEEPELESMPTTSCAGKVRFRSPAEQSRSPLSPPAFGQQPASAPITVEQQSKATPSAKAALPQQITEKAPAAWEKRRGPASDTSSVILEQAWIMKMADEIARRVYDEKRRNPGFWEERDEIPPPAYEAR